MSGNLSSAAEDRKARLAALKSLKRKQPDQSTETDDSTNPFADTEHDPNTDVSSILLSGRNYDATTRAPKLGFENDPSAQENTLERKAQELAEATKKQAEQEELHDKPLDLFKLQPKKPNWDLKRDLDRKLVVLNVRTDNAIANLVRQRIAATQAEKRKATGVNNNEGEAVGMEGAELLEATNLREKEDEEDARREEEAQADLLDGS
jgi:coiled-coil domain-containing protein 12